MEKIFLFPGQGTQYAGMYNTIRLLPEAVEIYDKASNILDIDLVSLCWKGSAEKLQQTQYTQIAIFTHSMALFNYIKSKNIKPNLVAGHSVGEFSALAAAGVLTFEEALKLVQVRGEMMSQVKTEGSMVSIIGLSIEKINEICERVRADGYIAVSLYNTQNQVVLSGQKATVDICAEMAKEEGATKAVKLKVSQAFHSQLMEEIKQSFIACVDKLNFRDATCPVILNCTAERTMDSNKIKEDIRNQITSTVQWYRSMQEVLLEKDSIFVEVGPGKSLSGMLRTIEKGRKAVITDAPRELAKFIQEYGMK